MRCLKLTLAAAAVLLAAACGQGSVPAASPAGGGGSSTLRMFLSRSSVFSSKDGDDLSKACAADIKKDCKSLPSGDTRQLARCLRDHSDDLSKGCRAEIERMRHEKHADDACAGACACGQTCVGEGEDDDHGDHDKDHDGSSSHGGKSSLRTFAGTTASHDASHDGDHDDDDLVCTGPCPTGLTACDGRCVDLRNDPDNCGRCDNECSEHGNEVCSAGTCQRKCGNDPVSGHALSKCDDACVDTRSDPLNCGACGLACGCDQVCSNGACVAAAGCPAGQHTCAGVCVPNNDVATCGASCTPCPTDPNGNGVATCDGNVCSIVCIPPTVLVGGACILQGGLRADLPVK